MAKNIIRTSKKVATRASKILRNDVLNRALKSVAANALVNRKYKTR